MITNIKVWDIKPEPKNAREANLDWMNNMTAQAVEHYGKKIEVRSWADIKWSEFVNGKMIVFPAIRRCPVCGELTTGCCDTSDYEREM